MRKFLIAGNWKMNGMFDSIREVCKIDQHSKELNGDLALCLPNTIINKAYENISNGKLIIGAQNCHHEESGAFTGDVSAEMLKNAGAKVIIVGHSERRQNYFENNEYKFKLLAVISKIKNEFSSIEKSVVRKRIVENSVRPDKRTLKFLEASRQSKKVGIDE